MSISSSAPGTPARGFNPEGLKDFFEWYLGIASARPKYHIFGHVHEEGLKRKAMPGGTTFLNVSYFENLRQLKDL